MFKSEYEQFLLSNVPSSRMDEFIAKFIAKLLYNNYKLLGIVGYSTTKDVISLISPDGIHIDLCPHELKNISARRSDIKTCFISRDCKTVLILPHEYAVQFEWEYIELLFRKYLSTLLNSKRDDLTKENI
jgi:hypothetical protein